MIEEEKREVEGDYPVSFFTRGLGGGDYRDRCVSMTDSELTSERQKGDSFSLANALFPSLLLLCRDSTLLAFSNLPRFFRSPPQEICKLYLSPYFLLVGEKKGEGGRTHNLTRPGLAYLIFSRNKL